MQKKCEKCGAEFFNSTWKTRFCVRCRIQRSPSGSIGMNLEKRRETQAIGIRSYEEIKKEINNLSMSDELYDKKVNALWAEMRRARVVASVNNQ